MYKLLLCTRYLRTRFIALASIISVMLGVATMIVVNSVMAGFSTEMRFRLHGLLSDVLVETFSLDGEWDPNRHMQLIQQAAGEDIAAMSPTVEVFGLDPQVIRPTALVLNVVVATIATVQFQRAGHFRPRLFLPLADGLAGTPGGTFGGGEGERPDVARGVSALEVGVGPVPAGRGGGGARFGGEGERAGGGGRDPLQGIAPAEARGGVGGRVHRQRFPRRSSASR